MDFFGIDNHERGAVGGKPFALDIGRIVKAKPRIPCPECGHGSACDKHRRKAYGDNLKNAVAVLRRVGLCHRPPARGAIARRRARIRGARLIQCRIRGNICARRGRRAGTARLGRTRRKRRFLRDRNFLRRRRFFRRRSRNRPTGSFFFQRFFLTRFRRSLAAKPLSRSCLGAGGIVPQVK